jgi:hypothetical protein
MSADRDGILGNLHAVEAERRRRSEHADLALKVVALKAFQQRRFTRTYADLLATERYGPACRFFLDELYGPRDFTHRDEQFVKIVSGLVTFFPPGVVATVASVAQLHALSELLDTAMAERLRDAQIAAADYVRAWQAVGRPADRHRQITLTVGVAKTLDRVTSPLMRKGVRAMRLPARAAGLTDLQRFVEAGFDAFVAMHGAKEFIATVQSREEAFAAAVFAADPAAAGVLGAGLLADLG